jgi:hypothetical protein
VSVKVACFIATGAIDQLLCEEVPLGQATWQNQKSTPYDFFSKVLGGIEKCPNYAPAQCSWIGGIMFSEGFRVLRRRKPHSAPLFKNGLLDWFHISLAWRGGLVEAPYQFWLWSDLQYGHQVAISDFPFRSITSEVLGQSISYFRGVWIRGGALSILVAIRLPIRLPGGHLEFCVLLHSAP